MVRAPRGSADVHVSVARDAFNKATGRDVENDAEIAALMAMLRVGLDEAETAARLEERPGGFETVLVAHPRRPGKRDQPRSVVAPVATLVHLLKPKPAALAIMLFGLHHQPGFVCLLPPFGPGFDVGDVARSIAKRLSAIAKTDRAAAEGPGAGG